MQKKIQEGTQSHITIDVTGVQYKNQEIIL
jgi:hypothetical protein